MLPTVCNARSLRGGALQAGGVNYSPAPRVIAERGGKRMKATHPPHTIARWAGVCLPAIVKEV